MKKEKNYINQFKIKTSKNKIAKRIAIILLVIFFIAYINTLNFNKISYIQSVNASTTRKVNPIGRIIGLKLYTNGVLVIGMSEIEGKDGNKCAPYKNCGIKEGDMIKSINGTDINNTNELIEIVNKSGGKDISIKYQREAEEIYTTIKPIQTSENVYMIGLWVRDAAAGLGTLTYYEQATSKFATLGHGINDVDTGTLLNISNGELVTSQIISIIKGVKGRAGEIRGIIDNGIQIGSIEKNTDIGVYGTVTNLNFINSIKQDEVSVATRNQIKTGKAYIICQLSNSEVQRFDIEIKRIYKSNSKDNKSMLIKITDEKLLNITGGIIPGMSGTPIIQDGRFIGAITNVLLNDPTQGYAIFADMMME